MEKNYKLINAIGRLMFMGPSTYYLYYKDKLITIFLT